MGVCLLGCRPEGFSALGHPRGDPRARLGTRPTCFMASTFRFSGAFGTNNPSIFGNPNRYHGERRCHKAAVGAGAQAPCREKGAECGEGALATRVSVAAASSIHTQSCIWQGKVFAVPVPSSAKKKKLPKEEPLSASMRRFLALKEAGKASRAPQEKSGLSVSTRNDDAKTCVLASSKSASGPGATPSSSDPGGATPASQPADDRTPDDSRAPAPSASAGKVRREPAPTQAAASQGVKTLKARKKAFLKAKDQRRRGKHLPPAGSEAEQLVQTRQVLSAPVFGEQAAAPMKAQLKRKHWVEGGEATVRHANTKLASKLQPKTKPTGMNKEEADRIQYDAIAGYRGLKRMRMEAHGVEFDAYNTPASLVDLAQADA